MVAWRDNPTIADRAVGALVGLAVGDGAAGRSQTDREHALVA